MPSLHGRILRVAVSFWFAALWSVMAHAQTVVTLGIADWQSGERVSWEERIAAFEKEHPEIGIQVIGTGGHWDKLPVLEAAGQLPDVFYIDLNVYFPGAILRGALLDLTRYVRRDPELSQGLFPLVEQAYGYRGGLYALTGNIGGNGLYYNKELFNEAGLAYPDGTWTWEALRERARKLTKVNADGKISQWGYGTNRYPNEWHPDWWWEWIWRFGGAITDDSEKVVTIESPEAAAGLEFFHSLMWEARVAPQPGEYGQWPIWELFPRRLVAMHPRFTSGAYNQDTYWDVAPLPRGPGGRNFMIASAGYAISARTKVPDAAWTFLRHWISSEPNAPGLPTLRSMQRYITNHPRRDAHLWVLYNPDYVKDGRLLPLTVRVDWNNFFSLQAKIMTPYYLNQQDAGTALAQLAQALRPMLAVGK